VTEDEGKGFFLGGAIVFFVMLGLVVFVDGCSSRNSRLEVQMDAARNGVGEFFVNDNELDFRWKKVVE